MNYKGKFTAVGSWPFTDVKEIVKIILDNFHDIPHWPQLPKLNFCENMYVQYSEGLPCIKIDSDNEKIYFDTSGNFFDEIQVTYENFLSENYDYFKISEEYSAGLYELKSQLESQKTIPVLKGQTLGPVSLCLSLTDENKRLIMYNEQMTDAILKACVCKAVWQANFLKELTEQLILFIDEPYLVSFGSAYINLTREQIITMLNEIIDKLHEMNIITGIHCCGNTDWSILMETHVDIINFDAYSYPESLSLYSDKINDFLSKSENSGLAWGIVPTLEEKINQETGDSLYNSFKEIQNKLIEKGVDENLLINRSLITPACGTGSLTQKNAMDIIKLLQTTTRE